MQISVGAVRACSYCRLQHLGAGQNRLVDERFQPILGYHIQNSYLILSDKCGIILLALRQTNVGSMPCVRAVYPLEPSLSEGVFILSSVSGLAWLYPAP